MIYYQDGKVAVVDDNNGAVASVGGNFTPETAACFAAMLAGAREYKEGRVLIRTSAPEFIAVEESTEYGDPCTTTYTLRQAGRASDTPCRFTRTGGEWGFTAPSVQDLLAASLALIKHLRRAITKEDDPPWWSTIAGNVVVFPMEDGQFEAEIIE